VYCNNNIGTICDILPIHIICLAQ